jgi:DNA-binding NtrC family response regulator
MSNLRVASLVPGIVGQIEECWYPHHFREAIKRCKNAFMPIEHLQVVLVRIDLVIEMKPCFESLEALQEIREEVLDFINGNPSQKEVPTHFKRQNFQLRILTAKKSSEKEETDLLRDNRDFIEENLTIQVFNDSKRDKKEAARRLGISEGRLVQRLLSYGAHP